MITMPVILYEVIINKAAIRFSLVSKICQRSFLRRVQRAGNYNRTDECLGSNLGGVNYGPHSKWKARRNKEVSQTYFDEGYLKSTKLLTGLTLNSAIYDGQCPSRV